MLPVTVPPNPSYGVPVVPDFHDVENPRPCNSLNYRNEHNHPQVYSRRWNTAGSLGEDGFKPLAIGWGDHVKGINGCGNLDAGVEHRNTVLHPSTGDRKAVCWIIGRELDSELVFGAVILPLERMHPDEHLEGHDPETEPVGVLSPLVVLHRPIPHGFHESRSRILRGLIAVRINEIDVVKGSRNQEVHFVQVYQENTGTVNVLNPLLELADKL